MKRTLINIIQIWMTEMTEIMRDKGILVFIIFVPLCYPLLYSYVYTNEVVRDVPFAVIDDCNSTTSREFVRKMDATPDARFVARCNDVAEAQQLLKESKIYGVLRIPKTFNQDIWRGEQTTVGLYCNMSSLLYYKALLLAANNVSLDMNRDIKVEKYLHPSTREDEEISRMPVEYDYISLYNPQSGFADALSRHRHVDGQPARKVSGAHAAQTQMVQATVRHSDGQGHLLLRALSAHGYIHVHGCHEVVRTA